MAHICLIFKFQVVSREISCLRTSLKETTVDNQIRHLDILSDTNVGHPNSSPEIEMLEQFARYLDFKRNDVIRASGRTSRGNESPQTMNIDVQNDLS